MLLRDEEWQCAVNEAQKRVTSASDVVRQLLRLLERCSLAELQAACGLLETCSLADLQVLSRLRQRYSTEELLGLLGDATSEVLFEPTLTPETPPRAEPPPQKEELPPIKETPEAPQEISPKEPQVVLAPPVGWELPAEVRADLEKQEEELLARLAGPEGKDRVWEAVLTSNLQSVSQILNGYPDEPEMRVPWTDEDPWPASPETPTADEPPASTPKLTPPPVPQPEAKPAGSLFTRHLLGRLVRLLERSVEQWTEQEHQRVAARARREWDPMLRPAKRGLTPGELREVERISRQVTPDPRLHSLSRPTPARKGKRPPRE